MNLNVEDEMKEEIIMNRNTILKYAFVIILFLTNSILPATEYYVSPDGDNTNGLSWDTAWNDIQFAIDHVENPTTESITVYLSDDVFVLNNDDILINRNFMDLTISGVLASSTFIQPVAEGPASNRIFQIGSEDNSEEVVTIKKLTIQNGMLNDMYECGGGILNYGNLTLLDCVIQNNSVIQFGAGIYSENNLTVDRCEISSNSIVEREGNDNSQGAGIYMVANSGCSLNLDILNTTISGNCAALVQDTQGVAIYLRTIRRTGSIDADIINCTIADNECNVEEGIEGKGLYLNNAGSLDLYITNCILSNGNLNYDIYGEGDFTFSRCSTICSDESLPLGGEREDLNSVDPLLGELLENNSINGTRTHEIDEASPALDAGSVECELFIDQRGFARDESPDIGSFEATDDAPLPVTLSSFTAAYTNSSSQISWTTQSESNNLGWNIYRSSSTDFTISTTQNSDLIDGAGTTTIETEYMFQDPYVVDMGSSYWYWLESISFSGESALFGPICLTVPIDGDGNNLPVDPDNFGLQQNYPNPFNPSTVINFSLPVSVHCELTVYDVTGRKVNNLFSGSIEAETMNSVLWDGRDVAGKQIASGVYLYKLKADKFNQTRKMILLK